MLKFTTSAFTLTLLLAGAGLQTASARDFTFKPYMADKTMETGMKNHGAMAAKMAAQPTVLVFSKAGCPVCAVQDPILKKLSMSETFKDFQFLEVAYESDKAANAKYNVSSQSTVIVLDSKGQEVARSTGVTNADALEDQLRKAL